MALHVTQCPSCESTFNTSARILDAAHGLVRCGACLSVFEAIEHIIDRLPPASNDESERQTPESVFISAPEDYFNPAQFLERNDLQDYDDPDTDELDEDAATEVPEAPEVPAFTEPAVAESPPGIEREQRKSSPRASERQPVARTDPPAEEPSIYDVADTGKDEAMIFATDKVRDSDFDVFDASPRVEVPKQQPEEEHDSTFDVFGGDKAAASTAAEWNPIQIEIHDSEFDIYGNLTFDTSAEPYEPYEPYEEENGSPAVEATPSFSLGFDPEVTILPPIDANSETMAVLREVLGNYEADEDDDFPMEADADEWYLEEDPDAEVHFRQGIQSGEIIILPAVAIAPAEVEPQEIVLEEDDLTGPLAPEASLDSEAEAVAAQQFEDDLESGKVVILPPQGNDSVVMVDNDVIQAAPDQLIAEEPVAQPLEQRRQEKSAEEPGETDTITEPLVESSKHPAPGIVPDRVPEPVATPAVPPQPEDHPEFESMAGNDEDEDEDWLEDEPRKADSKQILRARLLTTELDEEEDDKRLSPENLRAVRGMDDTLELEEQRISRRIRRAFALVCACIVVLTGVLGVFAWQRLPVLSLDPALRPFYVTACNLLGCQLPVYRNTTLIETDNLVVRSHPSQPDALELTAIFSNQARFDQPFPVIELQFRDLDNRLVESREFMPVEYLPQALRSLPGMPVRSPVQITLQLPDPGPTAVNYQLNFKTELSPR